MLGSKCLEMHVFLSKNLHDDFTTMIFIFFLYSFLEEEKIIMVGVTLEGDALNWFW